MSDTMLAFSRQAFRRPPRQFRWWPMVSYLRARPPKDLGADDALQGVLREQEAILQEGEIVWGHVLTAEPTLYRRGLHSGVADVVFSLELNAAQPLEYLTGVVTKLAQGGPTNADEKWRAAQHQMNSDRQRVFGLPVPDSASPHYPCLISSTVIDRRHLPTRMLSLAFLPLVVTPEAPHRVLVLPSRYWHPGLVDLWRDPAKQMDRLKRP